MILKQTVTCSRVAAFSFTGVSRDFRHFHSHLGREHVRDAVDGPFEQQTSHQKAEEHHIGEEGAEVHHLRQTDGQTEPDRYVALPWRCLFKRLYPLAAK